MRFGVRCRAWPVAALVWALCAPAFAADALASIERVRVGSHPTYDRIVLELDRTAPVSRWREEAALVIEVAATPRSASTLPRSLSGRLASLELRPGPEGVRAYVKADLHRVRAFRLENPDRIVIDVGAADVASFEPPDGVALIPERAVPAAKPPTTAPPRPAPPIAKPPVARPPEETVTEAPAPVGEPPKCVRDCDANFQAGQLRPDVSLETCKIDQCLRESRIDREELRYAKAIATLDFIAADAGKTKEYALERGRVLYGLGRFSEAVTNFDIVLAEDPNDFLAGSHRAHALARMGELEEAQKQFESVSERQPEKASFNGLNAASYLRGSIGLVKLQRGELEEGRADLTRALELDEHNGSAEAALDLLPYLEDGTLAPRGLSDLLAFYEEDGMGQSESAEASLRSLIAASPGFVPGYTIWADRLVLQGRDAECVEMMEVAIARIPNEPELQLHLKRCQLLRYGRDSDKGKAVAREARQLAQANPDSDLARELLENLGQEPVEP